MQLLLVMCLIPEWELGDSWVSTGVGGSCLGPREQREKQQCNEVEKSHLSRMHSLQYPASHDHVGKPYSVEECPLAMWLDS